MNITFVCTGNTCRSAMAEGICKKKLNDRGITEITCCSCGLSAFTGDSASENAIKAAKKLGVNISAHRSRQFNQYICDNTDLMVCMTQAHKNAVASIKPKFKILVPDGGITDPYGADEKTYEKCAEQLYSYINRLLDALTAEIRPMTETDIEQIAQIEKQCFSSPWSETGLKEELSNKNAHFLVAASCEKVLGYIGVHEICGEAYIANIAVKIEYRRLGIGEKLLKTAQNGAFVRKCNFISLEVRKSNAIAVELYRKLGYNTAGERKDFYSDPVENAIIMTLKECEN